MKWPFLILITLGLVLLQTSAVPAFELLGVGSNLLLVALCCWVVVRNRKESMVLVPLAGLMLGLLSSQGLTAAILALLPIVLLAALRIHLGIRSDFAWTIAIVIAATLTQFIITATILEIDGSKIDWAAVIVDVLLPTVLVNFIIAIPVYWIAWVLSQKQRSLVSA